MEQKQYGLIHLSKQNKQNKQLPIVKPSIFNDSDSDEEKSELTNLQRSSTRKQTQIDISRVLQQDSTAFQYDEIYDEMKTEKEKVSVKKEKKVPAPKYINNLMKHAELRKKEQERRTERKIQKEREQEGDEFADKEAFVTSAYKEKLLEMQEAEEKEKKEKAIEDMLDVRKQKDLSGFYRHLLNRTIESSGHDAEKEQVKETSDCNFDKSKRKVERKNLRTRKQSSSDSSENEDEEKTEEKNEIKIEKQEEESNHDHDKTDNNNNQDLNITNEKSEKDENNEGNKELKDDSLDKLSGENEKSESDNKTEEGKSKKKEKVDRMTILIEKFKKRTIGKVFDEARERYLIRKRSRLL